MANLRTAGQDTAVVVRAHMNVDAWGGGGFNVCVCVCVCVCVQAELAKYPEEHMRMWHHTFSTVIAVLAVRCTHPVSPTV